MPSLIAPSPTSPIARLPYEILQEIFTHCLPRYPLHQRQPSTKTTPILLCHVCSTWRGLALASATLWAHLSYSFTVRVCKLPGSVSGTPEFKDGDIEFIRWWKGNHGQIAPFISFKADLVHHVHQNPATNNSAFLLNYITSAQHLDLDPFFWNWLLAKHRTGHLLCFPDLHTALTGHTWSGNNPLRKLQTLLSPETVPALRRLAFSELCVPSSDFAPPTHWAALTHISMYYAPPLPFWHSLIRALPCLRWGYFDLIPTPPFNTTHDTAPQQSVLRELSTLLILVRSTSTHEDVFPLSSLFAALHLPTLRSLSLSAPGVKAWEDAHMLSELSAILRSTPAIEELMLEDNNDGSAHYGDLPPAIRAAAPVWARAPHLARIRLALPPAPPRATSHHAEPNQGLALFVHRIFSSEWLDLRNPASPVRKVTIAISDNGARHRPSEATMASVREGMPEVPGVVLEFTEESVGLAVADVWKEWGARI